MTILVTGPVRAGKSDFAQRLALERGGPVVFVATARRDPADREFADRIERHRRARPPDWTTIETAGPPRADLLRVLRDVPRGTTAIVDSLGTWLAEDLPEERLAELDPIFELERLEARGLALADALGAVQAGLILVSEETGWGLVPTTPLGRIFRDALGRLNRRVAAVAQEAYLVVSGYALDLKTGRPVGPPA